MKTRRDVFQAIADPTRRRIIGLLANQSLNLNSISENFDISRQAISLHIKILQECNLINVRQQGRERICEVKLESLNEVVEWTEQFESFWTKKLLALKTLMEEETTTSTIPLINPVKKTRK